MSCFCFADGTGVAKPNGDIPTLWIGVQIVDAARDRDQRVTMLLIAAGPDEDASSATSLADFIVTVNHARLWHGFLVNAACQAG